MWRHLDNRDVPALKRRDLTSWLARDRPDYWIVHGPTWPFERAMATPEFKDHYRQVVEIDTPYSLRTRTLVIYRRT